MSFDLSSITVGEAPLPPRFVIYGQHGVGKTTLAASAPAPVVLRTEKGLAALAVPTFPLATSYGDVVAALNTLIETEHPFQSFVLDTLDWLEALVWAEVAQANGVADISAIDYGRGYLQADEKWHELLAGFDALRERGMLVILLAHSEVKRFDAPNTEPYDRYQIKLHKRAAALVQEWPDVVGFLHYEVFTESTDVGFRKKVTRGVGAGARVLAVEERPAWYAKNRFGMPAELAIPRHGGFGALLEPIVAAVDGGLGAPWMEGAGAGAEPGSVEYEDAQRAEQDAALPGDDDPAAVCAATDALLASLDEPVHEPDAEEYAEIMSTVRNA